ncbi:hypothetical protein C0J52_12379 [Blattella germanica]|nr:hypothetical protein C0J52_12379 [Blattella germanica]
MSWHWNKLISPCEYEPLTTANVYLSSKGGPSEDPLGICRGRPVFAAVSLHFMANRSLCTAGNAMHMRLKAAAESLRNLKLEQNYITTWKKSLLPTESESTTYGKNYQNTDEMHPSCGFPHVSHLRAHKLCGKQSLARPKLHLPFSWREGALNALKIPFNFSSKRRYPIIWFGELNLAWMQMADTSSTCYDVTISHRMSCHNCSRQMAQYLDFRLWKQRHVKGCCVARKRKLRSQDFQKAGKDTAEQIMDVLKDTARRAHLSVIQFITLDQLPRQQYPTVVTVLVPLRKGEGLGFSIEISVEESLARTYQSLLSFLRNSHGLTHNLVPIIESHTMKKKKTNNIKPVTIVTQAIRYQPAADFRLTHFQGQPVNGICLHLNRKKNENDGRIEFTNKIDKHENAINFFVNSRRMGISDCMPLEHMADVHHHVITSAEPVSLLRKSSSTKCARDLSPVLYDHEVEIAKIFGIMGACLRHELHQLKVNNVKDIGKTLRTSRK